MKSMTVENSQRPLLGAHISIAGGVENAPQRGRAIGCDCIQIFSKSQNQWHAKPYTPENIQGFKEGVRKYNIKSVLIHDSYLINLASPDATKYKMSFDAFMDEIHRADQLGVDQLVFHPGSHMGAGEEAGIRKIADSLNRVIENNPKSKVRLLLEITAGQGTNLGYKFEHLAEIIHKVEDKSRMGICFDTAHAFVAGFDFRTKEKYEENWKKFDDIIGLKYLKAFHLNDSKKYLLTKVDRHQNIGKGYIGLDMFKMLLNDSRFTGLGMYLETPGGELAYKQDLATLRSLIIKA